MKIVATMPPPPCQRHGATVSPCHHPYPLAQIYQTVDSAAEFNVLFDEDEEQRFLTALGENGNAAKDAFASIDIRKAGAHNAEDKARIFAEVEAGPGAGKVNQVVIDRMNQWALRVAEAEVETWGALTSDLPLKVVELLVDQGGREPLDMCRSGALSSLTMRRARALAERVVEERKAAKVHGEADARAVLEAKGWLGYVLAEQARRRAMLELVVERWEAEPGWERDARALNAKQLLSHDIMHSFTSAVDVFDMGRARQLVILFNNIIINNY